MSLRKYRYYSPINVQRKIFSFKKNELIDITNKNNFIVIIKRKCKSINKKYNFGKKGIEINYDENNKRLFENKLNSYITPKNLIMINGKMKETSMINKPKENLELKLFSHKRRNSVMLYIYIKVNVFFIDFELKLSLISILLLYKEIITFIK